MFYKFEKVDRFIAEESKGFRGDTLTKWAHVDFSKHFVHTRTFLTTLAYARPRSNPSTVLDTASGMSPSPQRSDQCHICLMAQAAAAFAPAAVQLMLRLSFLYERRHLPLASSGHARPSGGKAPCKLEFASPHRCAYLRSWAFDAAVSSFSFSLRFFSAALSTGNVFKAFSQLAFAHLRIFFAVPSCFAESQTASTTSAKTGVYDDLNLIFEGVAEIALLRLIYTNAFQGIQEYVGSDSNFLPTEAFEGRQLQHMCVCVCARADGDRHRNRTYTTDTHTEHLVTPVQEVLGHVVLRFVPRDRRDRDTGQHGTRTTNGTRTRARVHARLNPMLPQSNTNSRGIWDI